MLVAGAAHPWVKEGGDASDMPLDISVLSNMREFVKYSRLKQLALRVNLSSLQICHQIFTLQCCLLREV